MSADPREPLTEDQATEYAQALHTAMKGWGTDELGLINILVPLTSANIQLVLRQFAEVLKRDLVKDIKSETSGDFETTLLALLDPPPVYDAKILHQAMHGLGANKGLMTEILATRDATELAEISLAYESLYKKKLLSVVEDETSGDLQKAYNLLLTADRLTPDDAQVAEDIKELYEAGEKKWGTNEGVFIRKLCGFSREYNEKLYYAYAETYGKALDAVIHSEMGGNLGDVLAALVTPLSQYFANKIWQAMKGSGTDEATVIRIIVSQKEKNLPAIAKQFLHDHKATLKVFIVKECGGDFKKVLSAICDHWASVVDK